MWPRPTCYHGGSVNKVTISYTEQLSLWWNLKFQDLLDMPLTKTFLRLFSSRHFTLIISPRPFYTTPVCPPQFFLLSLFISQVISTLVPFSLHLYLSSISLRALHRLIFSHHRYFWNWFVHLGLITRSKWKLSDNSKSDMQWLRGYFQQFSMFKLKYRLSCPSLYSIL